MTKKLLKLAALFALLASTPLLFAAVPADTSDGALCAQGEEMTCCPQLGSLCTTADPDRDNYYDADIGPCP